MLRHQFLRAPLFLPLVAVGAAIPGGWWYALSGLVVLAAMGLRLWRIGMCALLCTLVAALHTQLLEQRAADFCRQAE